MGQTLSGGDIYDNFHTRATGTGSLVDSQEAGLRLSQTYLDRADTVQKLIEGIRSGWTGAASDAATQGLMPFAESALQTGQDLDSAQDLIYRQVDSFHSAAARVQPMPPEPAMQNVITTIANNQPIQPMINQIQSYNSAAANNVDVYNEYANASQFNAINTPDVSGTMSAELAPVRVIGSAMPSPQTSPSVQALPSARTSPPPQVSQSNGAGGGLRTPAPSGTRPAGSASVGPESQAGQGEDSTPAGQGAQLQSGPVAGEGVTGPMSTAEEPVDTSMPTVGPTTAANVPKTATGERAGARASNGAAVGPLLGGRGSAGTGADDGAGERVEPVIDGKDGEPGAFGGPAGAGPARDEDKEHQRKYQLGDDPDALFVSPTGALAPEVLGELESERVARHERESGR